MREHGSIYLHLSNGGTTFKVVDNGQGPQLVAESSSFGNMISYLDIKTDGFGLTNIGLMLLNAAREKFSPVYSAAMHYLPKYQSSDFGTGSTDADPRDAHDCDDSHDCASNTIKRSVEEVSKSANRVAYPSPDFLNISNGKHIAVPAEEAALALLHVSAYLREYKKVPADRCIPIFGLSWHLLQWLWDRGYIKGDDAGHVIWANREAEEHPYTKHAADSPKKASSGLAGTTRQRLEILARAAARWNKFGAADSHLEEALAFAENLGLLENTDDPLDPTEGPEEQAPTSQKTWHLFKDKEATKATFASPGNRPKSKKR